MSFGWWNECKGGEEEVRQELWQLDSHENGTIYGDYLQI